MPLGVNSDGLQRSIDVVHAVGEKAYDRERQIMKMSVIDSAMQTTFPMIIAPIDGELPPTEKAGIRYIATAKGLVREVATPWLIERRIFAACVLPYGEVALGFEFLMNDPPMAMWQAFQEQATRALPNEAAAVMCWNTVTKAWRLAERQSSFADPEKIDYIEPALLEDEIAVIDVHSHGDAPAFFSSIDNQDDMGGIKIAACFGSLSSSSPMIVMRLVTIDKFTPLSLSNGIIVRQM